MAWHGVAWRGMALVHCLFNEGRGTSVTPHQFISIDTKRRNRIRRRNRKRRRTYLFEAVLVVGEDGDETTVGDEEASLVVLEVSEDEPVVDREGANC